ncbi:DUF551 domain-containing protein [Brucella intermedia]|uniref:DUF551 domain-containing protein n=1 Tax=Brucella intermedia TaxID=94625 RepID=UPI00124DA1E8|nr:DUF551 domain-containing protein [Brucella intermedia]KAB2712833.1 DUF551 domain-containing protein [Brucella intermedia]
MGAKRMRTSRQQLIEEPATLADRTANGAGADAEPAHKLALEEVKTSGATDVRGLIKTYANAAFEQQGKDIPKYIWHLHFEEFATAIRALSSPDHADAGKVEGDGWRPIESAPKDGTPVLIAWQAVASVRGEKQWFQTVAHYDDSFEIAGYDEETGDAHKRGAWTDGAVASWAYEEIREISPTHWRPLPSAPSEGSDA